MKRIGLLLVVAALAVFLSTVPAVAAKQSLNEDEMDLVTAAGQPEVIIAVTVATLGGSTSTFVTDALTITLTKTGDFNLAVASNGQNRLRALAVNNVVGENTLANAFNIQGLSSAGTTQTNEVNQSWGSTLDVGGSAASAASITISGKCIICDNTAGGNIGTVGGYIDVSGKAIITNNKAGGSAAGRRSIYADEILIGSTIFKFEDTQLVLALDANSQAQLNALVVNNVVGLNLVANLLNIAGGAVNLSTDPLLAGTASGVQFAAPSQINTARQYRGTPLSRP